MSRRAAAPRDAPRAAERGRALATAVAIVWLGAGAVACSTAGLERPVGRPLDDNARRVVAERADRTFVEGFLWKPPDTDEADTVHALAPLLIEEIHAGQDPSPRFGALVAGAREELRVGPEPTVYWHEATVTLAGEEHSQRTYVWWYAGDDGDAPLPRGVRMTLDRDGFPAVYEILGDTSGALPVFVSPALDAAAAAAWGSPLPGRAFAVERATDETPNVVVLDLVEPGPAPLGPFVYLEAAHRDVVAVVCRCMPSRVAAIPDTANYRLIRAGDDARIAELLTRLDPGPLDGNLRLPPEL